jgi:outer membrane protein assembly factor BamB
MRPIGCARVISLETGCRVFAVAVVLALLVEASSSADAADWTTYRGNNERTGSTPEEFPGSSLKWTYQASNPPRRAWTDAEGRTIEGHIIRDRVTFDDAFQPVVAGNRVYFGSTSDHQLHCLNLASGESEWAFFTGGPIRLAPTIADGRAYFGSDDGYAYCVDAASGKLVWKYRAAPMDEWFLGRGEMVSRWAVRTGVLIKDGLAYFGAGIFPHEDVYLYALDAKTGDVVWKRDDISEADAGRDDLSPQGYLLASEELLFVPSGRSMPATFERATGKLLHKKTYSWRSTAGGVVGGPRAILADGQLYSGGAHHLLAIEQKTGDVGFGWFDGREMVVAGDSAYVVTGTVIAKLDRNAYAVNSRRVQKLENDLYKLSGSLRSAKNEKADGIRAQMKAVQAELKEIESVGIVWQKDCSADASLLATGDTILAGGDDGEVIGFNATTGNTVLKLSVPGKVRGLVVANGHFIVSTTTGAVICHGDGPLTEIAEAEAQQFPNPYPEDEITKLCRETADQIAQTTQLKDGFCLVAGSEDGRLAYELAQRTNLKIYGVEPDLEKVEASRAALDKAGLYGTRVTIYHGELSEIPFSNFFANLIVSDTQLRTGTLPGDWSGLFRHLKPLGGVAMIATAKTPKDAAAETLTAAVKEFDKLSSSALAGGFAVTRGPLTGAADWSHHYGNPANTAIIPDTRVKGDLGVLWYGDPGPGEMVNRHEGAVGPLSVNGRLLVQGDTSILAYDAYNGQFLWKHENPNAIRTGVFQNQNPGNLAASANPDRVFHFIGDVCYEVDAANGLQLAAHRLPKEYDDGKHQWGYIAIDDGVLFGTASVREEIEARSRRRGKASNDSTDGIFAIDIASGKHLWSFKGGSISHHTIAIGDGSVFFIDSTITSEERARLLREDKSELVALTGKEREIAEDRMKKIDARTAVALNAKTGEKLWGTGVDVTDCSEIGIGGGKLTLMYQDGVLILCGANANGHYWNQFIAGDFSRRRLVALASESGYTMWKKDANYRHRPIIVGSRIIAEPWSFELKSGEQITQKHPLTGEDVPWSMIRPGHHCGMLTGATNLLMFRSGYTGFFNLDTNEGTRHFAGHRLGCWINAIPANGLVMIPEASAGCVCQFSIASTIVLEPRETRRPWTIVSATGAKTPVRKMSLNFGAPGDRRDAKGNIWLAYPRPDPHKTTSLDLFFDLKPKFAAGGFTSVSDRSHPVQNTDTPWLYTSWASGLDELTLPLRGKGDNPATYELKLHFAQVKAATSRFDVEVNGEIVLTDIAVSRTEDTHSAALVKLVPSVNISKDLVIRLIPKTDDPAAKGRAVLNALELRELEAVAAGQ